MAKLGLLFAIFTKIRNGNQTADWQRENSTRGEERGETRKHPIFHSLTSMRNDRCKTIDTKTNAEQRGGNV